MSPDEFALYLTNLTSDIDTLAAYYTIGTESRIDIEYSIIGIAHHMIAITEGMKDAKK